MEAKEYLEARSRAMKKIGFKINDCSKVECSDCCWELGLEIGCFKDIEEHDPEEAVNILQEWAERNKVVTNAMKFEEVFGGSAYDENSRCYICPPSSMRKECTSGSCRTCMAWWDEEYKAPKTNALQEGGSNGTTD